jgi:DTW domain-containing protein YfiP
MRPKVVCYCEFITELETRTRVLLLQHPRERDVGIGTARIAKLSLPNSELRVGVDFSEDPVVKKAVTENAYLLFPSKTAIDLHEVNQDKPITLVVVDGTWWQARKLWRRNPMIAALPHVRFTPNAPSNYRIRREPADHCVATIEALAHVLGTLEGDPERFQTMLTPFHKMVEKQLEYARTQKGTEVRHAAARQKRALLALRKA